MCCTLIYTTAGQLSNEVTKKINRFGKWRRLLHLMLMKLFYPYVCEYAQCTVYKSTSKCAHIVNDKWTENSSYIFFFQKLNQSLSKDGRTQHTYAEHQFIFHSCECGWRDVLIKLMDFFSHEVIAPNANRFIKPIIVLRGSETENREESTRRKIYDILKTVSSCSVCMGK